MIKMNILDVKALLEKDVEIECIDELYAQLFGEDLPLCMKGNYKIIIAFINNRLKEHGIERVLRRSGTRISKAKDNSESKENVI